MQEMAATENSLVANDSAHSVCGMLTSAEIARRNVPTLTRREADGPEKGTQQSWRSLDDEGLAAIRRLVKTVPRGRRLLRKLDARWSPSTRKRVSRGSRCRRVRRFGDRP